MKPFLFILLASTAISFAQPEVTPSIAGEFLKVTRYEELIIESAVANFDQMAKQMVAQGVPPAAIPEIREEARKMYVSIFTGPEIRKKMIDLYNKTYTESELTELVTFYRTPVGQKSLTVMRTLADDAMKLALPDIQEQTPIFQKKMAEIVEKNKKATE